ncbi:hypothetical protein ABW21_db0206929 [Orbilia brochopaga]|nr:hypothetical protein ABW21_db0206929 [Drechslerella brochopaga]
MWLSAILFLAYYVSKGLCDDAAPIFWDPGDARWKVEECSLGLFSNIGFDQSQPYWIGDPLQDLTRPAGGNCSKLDDLNMLDGKGSLSKKVNGYRIRGACNCTFSEEDSCQKPLFDAKSRDDDDILRTGNGNKIASILCVKDYGAACSVNFYRFRTYNNVEDSPKDGPDDQQEYYPFALDPSNACLPVPDPLKGAVTSLIQRYCARCKYYDNPNCDGDPLLEYYKINGEVGVQDLEVNANKIVAYKCDQTTGKILARTGPKGEITGYSDEAPSTNETTPS